MGESCIKPHQNAPISSAGSKTRYIVESMVHLSGQFTRESPYSSPLGFEVTESLCRPWHMATRSGFSGNE